MTAQVKSSQPTFTVGSESVIRNRNYKITDLFLANISTFEFRKKNTLRTVRNGRATYDANFFDKLNPI